MNISPEPEYKFKDTDIVVLVGDTESINRLEKYIKRLYIKSIAENAILFFVCFKQESNELYMKNLQRIKISKNY